MITNDVLEDVLPLLAEIVIQNMNEAPDSTARKMAYPVDSLGTTVGLGDRMSMQICKWLRTDRGKELMEEHDLCVTFKPMAVRPSWATLQIVVPVAIFEEFALV